METLTYRNDRLFCEDVDLAEVASTYGTPCYIYSRQALEQNWRLFDAALADCDHLICYAVKANSNLAVLNVLARLGSGFDIVSVGELERVLAAGGDPAKVIFSGVGKTDEEMRRALSVGISCFNVESSAELEALHRVACEVGQDAPVALRVNPDVDALSHPYIATGLRENKFGIPLEQAAFLYAKAASMARIVIEGIDCHIGSQLTSLAPIVDALERVLRLTEQLAAGGLRLRHINVGGGLGIRYRDETPPAPLEYVNTVRGLLVGHSLRLVLEPGRAIAGNAGILLTRTLYRKTTSAKHHFAIVDAAMNDLLRVPLYGAWHEIVPVKRRAPDPAAAPLDVVGPVCESADYLGRERPLDIRPGDLMAVRCVGAYGFVMSSNYNSRPRAPEIMVDGHRAHLVRARESVQDLFALESVLPS
ncbi:MAG: diaminopimelate decarboxylase [Gammaproteobacteria bacterium]